LAGVDPEFLQLVVLFFFGGIFSINFVGFSSWWEIMNLAYLCPEVFFSCCPFMSVSNWCLEQYVLIFEVSQSGAEVAFTVF